MDAAVISNPTAAPLAMLRVSTGITCDEPVPEGARMAKSRARARHRPGQALTVEEKLLAVTLRQQGLTHKQIGERLGRARESVCKALRATTDASQLLQDKARAKAILEAAAQEVAKNWIAQR